MKSYQLVSIAMLAAVAAALQFYNGVAGIPTGFGMTVDLAAVPVILAFFLFGLEASLYVLAGLALVITFASPTSWLGASMKVAATLPMVLVPAFAVLAKAKKSRGAEAVLWLSLVSFLLVPAADQAYFSAALGSGIARGVLPIAVVLAFAFVLSRVWKKYAPGYRPGVFGSVPLSLAVLAAAVFVRGALMAVANFYYAGPLYFKMSQEAFVAFMSGVSFPLFGAGVVPWYLLIFFWNAVQAAVEFGAAWVIAFRFGFADKYAEF